MTFRYNNPYHDKMSREFAGGYIGGALGILVTHPIDTVRVRLQHAATNGKTGVTYSSIINNIRRTIGIKGLFRGVLPPVTLRGFSMGMNRAGYEFASKITEGQDKSPPKGWKLTGVSAFSGLCQTFVDLPLYNIKCRAQTTKDPCFNESFRGYYRMAKEITVKEGYKGWTNGFIPASACSMLSYPILYGVYDKLRENNFSPIIAGAIAGAISWPIGLPFDTIRIKMQTDKRFVPFTKAAHELFKQPVKKWWIGLGATMVRAAPRYAIIMWTVENSNKFFKN
tara:strand:+ start:1505 stop:2347 length:843 start_codon:yes stop_codon:yes gene_type:complete